MLQKDDLIVLRDREASAALDYAGQVRESKVLVYTPDRRSKAWIQSSDIRSILRLPELMIYKPGLYQSAIGSVFLHDSTDHWWLIRHSAYIGGERWLGEPLSVNESMVRRNMPLIPMSNDLKPEGRIMSDDAERMKNALIDSVRQLKKVVITFTIVGIAFGLTFAIPAGDWWVWLVRGIILGIGLDRFIMISVDYMRAGRIIEQQLQTDDGAEFFDRVFNKENQ
ncbi:hypothetical protein [Bifidobacterium callitrichidarum]|nr:hypothetical protein [Bifidobacterium callitrichidarum]